MQNYAAPYLSHFVGFKAPLDHERNFGTLSKVLQSSSVAYNAKTAGTHGLFQYTFDPDGDLLKGELVVPNVTCYADIPAGELEKVHCRKYGYFGLAFRKDLLIRHGVRPVTYLPYFPNDSDYGPGRMLAREMMMLARGLDRETERLESEGRDSSRNIGTETSSAADTMHLAETILQKDVLAFVKAFEFGLADDDPQNFYMEREWRKFGNLLFKPDDVMHVFVMETHLDQFVRAFPKFTDKVFPLKTP